MSQTDMSKNGTSGTTWAAVAVAVVAIILSVAAIGMALTGTGGSGVSNASVTSLNSSVSSLSSQLAGMASSGGAKPTTVAYKVDWCNTDNTGEDRYCPNQLIVNQGDTVQIMFLHNDSDVHTFTLDTGSYNFQINGSAVGMHDFLTNDNLVTACSNGPYTAESSGISGSYCVSGSSLLQPGGNFRIAQNTNPANSPPNLVDVAMDNTVHVVVFNDNASEIWGVGSFQATTPGIYEFFCHYHVSNGMFGYLIVLPNSYCTANPSSCGLS
jgi:plastocyanin